MESPRLASQKHKWLALAKPDLILFPRTGMSRYPWSVGFGYRSKTRSSQRSYQFLPHWCEGDQLTVSLSSVRISLFALLDMDLQEATPATTRPYRHHPDFLQLNRFLADLWTLLQWHNHFARSAVQ